MSSDALFSHSIQLLPLLNNPLNIELLSRHILQSPAIWIRGTQNPQRHLRIVSGFRASLGWKVKDLEEGKGGLNLDEWIVAIGRGAIGNGTPVWRGGVDSSACLETYFDVYGNTERDHG